MQLSVYLFDDKIKSTDVVSAKIEKSGYKAASLRPEAGLSNVAVYTKKYPQSPPDWVDWVAPWTDLTGELPSSWSLSAIVLLLVRGRVFAIPFGFGHTALDKGDTDPDFGFQVGVRILRPRELNLIDIRNLDWKTRQKRSSLSFKGTLQEFDVAIDNELAFKIAGICEDKTYGNRAVGGTSFSFATEDTVHKLIYLCERLLDTLNKPVKKEFAQMNRYDRETDTKKLDALDAWLVGQFSGGAYDGVSVAIPELETTRIAQFAICKGHAGRNVQDLRIDDVVEALGEVTDGAFSLDGVYVKALSADRQPLGRYDLRQCLVAESSVVSSAESVHILSLGKWHKVKTDFVAEINSEVARIERIQDPTYLPVCGDGWEEGRYNKEIVPIYKDYVCFDCDDFRQGLGHSAIEVCDLYSNERHLICVKRYHSSQTLSHLFAQGSVSAHFLRSSREYREFLYSKAGTTGLFDVNDIDKTPFTVVYAIVMDWDKSVPDDIPFFSKVNLLDHVRNIRGLGFDLRLHHIPLVPAPGWNADKRKKRKKKVKAGGATSN